MAHDAAEARPGVAGILDAMGRRVYGGVRHRSAGNRIGGKEPPERHFSLSAGAAKAENRAGPAAGLRAGAAGVARNPADAGRAGRTDVWVARTIGQRGALCGDHERSAQLERLLALPDTE